MGKLIAVCTVLLAVASLGLAGCSTLYQRAVASIRQPGEHIATTPDRIWREFNCDNRARPFVQAESLQVMPEQIQPGARINYRLVYVMCPFQPSQVLATRLSRKILYSGKQVAINVNEAFEVKPGRWVVDSFFTLPSNAPVGTYQLEVSFESPRGQAHKQVRSFVVANGGYLSG